MRPLYQVYMSSRHNSSISKRDDEGDGKDRQPELNEGTAEAAKNR